jgi:hypothetical protein
LYGSGVGIHFRSSSGDIYIVGNTIDNVDKGIQFPSGITSAIIHNNIFSNRSDASAYDLMMESSFTLAFDYNLSSGYLRIYRSGTSYSTASSYRSATGQCADRCVESNPLFSNLSARNYTLRVGSPAIDKGFDDSVYSIFQNTYGIDIRKDIVGTNRPYNSVWDIGAYESTGIKIPKPPTNLVVE